MRNKCKENNQNKRAVAVELLQVNLFAGDVWFVGAERGRWDGSERHESRVQSGLPGSATRGSDGFLLLSGLCRYDAVGFVWGGRKQVGRRRGNFD